MKSGFLSRYLFIDFKKNHLFNSQLKCLSIIYLQISLSFCIHSMYLLLKTSVYIFEYLSYYYTCTVILFWTSRPIFLSISSTSSSNFSLFLNNWVNSPFALKQIKGIVSSFVHKVVGYLLKNKGPKRPNKQSVLLGRFSVV